MLAGNFAKEIIERSRHENRRTIVDPKQRDYATYAGADLLTPNCNELAEASGLVCVEDADIETAARSLIGRHNFGGMLVTRGPRGMSLVRPDKPTLHVASHAREVFDVSGAGDTVIATLATSLAAGFTLEEAVLLANEAAGIVVSKLGTATCTLAELACAITGAAIGYAVKIVDAAHLDAVLASWRQANLRVGFTNGCFDLLHPGHVALMRQARAACDRLVVGLNADDSVRRLKGPTRPVNDEQARAAVLASLADVDLVCVFAEDTPLRLIETVRPDVLVKGADYTRDTVVGADLVESWGGKVVLAELSPGFSTTATIGLLASR